MQCLDVSMGHARICLALQAALPQHPSVGLRPTKMWPDEASNASTSPVPR